MRSGSPFIRLASFALLLSVGLSVFISRAEESSDFTETNSVLRIEDLTPEARVAVSNLAGFLSASSSGDRAAATVDDNVAAILTILQTSFAAGGGYLKTYPFARSGVAFWNALLTQINDNPGRTPAQNVADTSSYFYQIQRAIYGSSGIPAQSDAIVPTLLRIEDLIAQSTNSSSSVDLSSVEWYLSSLDSNVGSIAGNMSYLSDIDQIVNNLSSILTATYADDASLVTPTDPAISVVDANVASALWYMEQTLQDIGYEVSNLEFPTEVAITNFGPIISWMETNLLATAHDEAQAADAHRDIEQSAEYNKAQAQAEIDDFEASDTSDYEQPFAGSAVVNPWNPLLSEARTLPDKISEKMPTFEETGGDTIVILDGQSERAEIRQIGNWSINVREELQDFVNQYGNLIDWFWDLFNSLTALGAILSIWHQVHDSM